MNDKLGSIRHDAQRKIAEALNDAFNLGQSEDVTQAKEDLNEALKHAQEAYEFFKVVINRMHFSDNNLEQTTMSYLKCIGEHLQKIEGIKK